MKYFREMLLASVAHKPMTIALVGGYSPRTFSWRILKIKAAMEADR